MRSVVIVFSLIRPGCPPLLSAEQCWLAATVVFHLCLPGPSSTSEPSSRMSLSPSGAYCSAFRWEFLVLDLPGSATVLRHLQPRQHSSPGEWFDLPGQFLAFLDLFVHLRPFFFGQVVSQKFCLDHLCRFLSWSCLLASQHDLFRRSQTSIVCFEYCSVPFPEV